MGRLSPQKWAGLAVLPAVGLILLWWADEQFIGIRQAMASTFELSVWPLVGWLLSMIAAGVMFGLAAGFGRPEGSRASVAATLLAAILPMAIAVHYFTFLGLGWSPIGIRPWSTFLFTQATFAASCVVVGILGTGLVGTRVARSH